NPWILSLRDPSEVRCVRRQRGREIQIGVVEKVEKFSTELHFGIFVHGEAPYHGQIRRLQTGSGDDAFAGVTKTVGGASLTARGTKSKHGRIEPLCRGVRSVLIRISYHVRTIIGRAAIAVISR